MSGHTVESLLNTSVEDCRVSLQYITDIGLLREVLLASQARGNVSRIKVVERRISQLKKEKRVS